MSQSPVTYVTTHASLAYQYSEAANFIEAAPGVASTSDCWSGIKLPTSTSRGPLLVNRGKAAGTAHMSLDETATSLWP
ncbi:hypothetical protein JB92DRAFT_2984662 [Gautieria morchelliformis]|nr:hypothetical protein JB92DRAFT_2984662 [Gautieria morchelliformis]